MANEIAVTDAKVIASINGWGQERFLPFFQGRNFDAWKQDAALAIIESKDLRECMTNEQGKITLVRALQRSASSGLSLNPQKGESALVPINGKVNFWPMKNGLIKKALETEALEFIESNTVYSADNFKIKKTARGDDYEFEPEMENRGEPKAYFAVAVMKTGRTVVEYWTKAQVQAHKSRYGKGLSRSDSAWNSSFDGMAEKTVLKALLTGLHLPAAVRSLIEADEQAEQEAMRDVTEPAPEHKGTGAGDLSDELAGKAAENEDTGPETSEAVTLEVEPGGNGLF